MKRTKSIQNLVLAALFLALGLMLPFLTGQIPEIGSMLLPMHLPILLCGLICGWKYGLAVGFIVPLLRSFLFTMPPMYPAAVAMAFELAAYGCIVGFLYGHSRWKCVKAVYRSMIPAMIGGRVIWGVAMVILLGVRGGSFTLAAFLSGAFLNAIPGIILQLVLIPVLMVALGKAKMIPFGENKEVKTAE